MTPGERDRALAFFSKVASEIPGNKIEDEYGVQGLFSRHEECVGCGIPSFNRYPHEPSCEWPEIVKLMMGEA